MSRELFNRMLLAIHGQGDELATPYRGCEGGCNQGRGPCDCELPCDVPPDASRTFKPAPMPMGMRARINRRAAYIGVSLFAGLAALLQIAEARWEP